MALINEAVDLNKEYSPSMWSQRFCTSEEVLRHHYNVVSEVSEMAINRIPHKLEIEYGSTPGQKLDILGTDLPNDAAIVVYIHGGFWQELSREVSRYPALPLYTANIKTIVIGYDLCPVASLPEIIDQIQRAATFVFEYAQKMDSKGVYFAGHSAGAHLVAKLLANSHFLENAPGAEYLRGAFLISGIFDLRELVHTKVNDMIQLRSEWTEAVSPQFDNYEHMRGKHVKFFIIAAQYDSPTFKRQSREFYELLQNTCSTRNVYLEIKDNTDHFDIVECLAEDRNFLRNLVVHDIPKHFT